MGGNEMNIPNDGASDSLSSTSEAGNDHWRHWGQRETLVLCTYCQLESRETSHWPKISEKRRSRRDNGPFLRIRIRHGRSPAGNDDESGCPEFGGGSRGCSLYGQ